MGWIMALGGLTLLLVVHEFGHFIVARLCGVKVLRFGIGMGPKIITLGRHKETEFSLHPLPIGAFVQLYGDRFELKHESVTEPNRSFAHKTPLQKIAILAAGPLANFVLAALLLIIPISQGTWTGFSLDNTPPRIYVGSVLRGHPADQAGIKPNMEILSVESGNRKLETSELSTYPLGDFLRENAGRAVVLTIREGNKTSRAAVIPRDAEYAIGLRLQYRSSPHALPESAVLALRTEWLFFKATVNAFQQMFARKINAAEQTGGPILIVSSLIASSYEPGIFFLMLGIISFFLGFFNLFFVIIPIVDGGRILLVLIEWVRRRPLSQKSTLAITMVGIVMVLGLLILATYNDISRLSR